jgi:hypothetical protein
MPPTPHRENDEIDLLNLVERSLRFFSRYLWLFAGAIILGLLAGFILYASITKTYESKMVVHSNMLTNQEEMQIVRNWNQLLTRGEHSALAVLLNIEPARLGKVKKLSAQEIQQVFTPVNPHGFIIEATVTDTSVLDELQTAILYGFDNSTHVKEKLAFNRDALASLITKTEEEIADLDSVKNSVGEIISGRGRASSAVIVDGSGLSRQIIDLNEKLIGLKRDLQFTNSVHLLQGFQKFSKPSDPNLLPLLVIGAIVFLAFAWVIAILHSVSIRLKQRRGAESISV